MKKILFVLSLFIVFIYSSSDVWADTDNVFGIQQIKSRRDFIHSQLKLSEKQLKLKENIDCKYYLEIEPQLKEMSIQFDNLQKLTKSGNCTKENVDLIKQNFEHSQKELSLIHKKYESEFKSALTVKQKVKYASLKRKAREKLKKEIKEEIKKQRSNR